MGKVIKNFRSFKSSILQAKMSIFSYNGGAVVAMKGANCVAIASDLRFGKELQTVTTDFSKCFDVSSFVAWSFGSDNRRSNSPTKDGISQEHVRTFRVKNHEASYFCKCAVKYVVREKVWSIFRWSRDRRT